MTEPSERSAALKAVRERKMAEWFGGRCWRVCSELNYEHDDVTVRNGEFWVKPDETGRQRVFRTPFGNKGTHGYVLQEIDVNGNDVWTLHEPDKPSGPVRALFGWVTIKHADEMFPGSIAEVPPRPYGQRGGVSAGLARQGGEE